jgi:hypothetical protein
MHSWQCAKKSIVAQFQNTMELGKVRELNSGFRALYFALIHMSVGGSNQRASYLPIYLR